MDELLDYEREHLAALRELAPDCMVLLKRRGDFPLAGPCPVALYGSGARRTVKGGTGSGDVNSRFAVTVERGLEDAGFTVTTKGWLDGYDAVYAAARRQFIADIKAEARRRHTLAMVLGMGAVMPEPAYDLPLDGAGDTAIYVLARNSGEGTDRTATAGDVLLTETEIRDILAIQAKYDHFLLALNVGGPVDLSPVAEAVDNILLLGQLGAVTGWALADVLLGVREPSGKLTTTWAAWGDYPAIGDFGQPDDTRYREGVYVGYRYFDSAGKAPMFPFGFGLGYTDFTYGRAAVALDGTAVTVDLPVTNAGSHPGREAVQVYLSLPWGKLDQPYQALAGFGKTARLLPGQSETVRITFRLEDLASYDADAAAYVLEAGRYILRAGRHSQDTVPAAVLTLDRTVTVRQVSHVGGAPDFEDWKPEGPISEDLAPDVPVLAIDPAAFDALTWPAPAMPSAESAVKAAGLTDEQLLYLCTGAFRPHAGPADMIGSASQTVAGAAGETYGGLDGVPALVMADGPAGLRLSQHYTRDETGAHPLGSTMPAGMEELMGPVLRSVAGRGRKAPAGPVLDQYCTAIPIGACLAQSWDISLCRRMGDIVGAEMERFGVHLWLAPALNIHRSILCGRNFEYYSEDPLISGAMAAAVTEGVQSHPGRGVTVKHFCCNSQETNRVRSNSAVSERALREIYLRGFQRCLAQADPAALMTSYNLLNGVHTSERSDLLRTVLREEWGWGGLVMTDWVISAMGEKGKYPLARSAPSLRAGNDLFMPGGPGDYKGALRALRGKDPAVPLTRADAETGAAHVLDAIHRLRDD